MKFPKAQSCKWKGQDLTLIHLNLKPSVRIVHSSLKIRYPPCFPREGKHKNNEGMDNYMLRLRQRSWRSPTHLATETKKIYEGGEITNSML